MSKITLDSSEVESMKIDSNTILLIARLVHAIEKLYGLTMKGFMFDILKVFSETYGKDKSIESQFCYEHLLITLTKLYPGEFQKELLKK
jgi:hypothetical protein